MSSILHEIAERRRKDVQETMSAVSLESMKAQYEAAALKGAPPLNLYAHLMYQKGAYMQVRYSCI